MKPYAGVDRQGAAFVDLDTSIYPLLCNLLNGEAGGGKAGSFSFDDELDGLFMVVEREPLSPGCLSNDDIDAHISRLQRDLEKVGAQMKRALASREPLNEFPG